MKINDNEIEQIGEIAKNIAKNMNALNADNISVSLDGNSKMIMVSVRVIEYGGDTE